MWYITDDEPKSHFIRPESYQVTWWPGDKPEEDINSDSTTGRWSTGFHWSILHHMSETTQNYKHLPHSHTGIYTQKMSNVTSTTVGNCLDCDLFTIQTSVIKQNVCRLGIVHNVIYLGPPRQNKMS